MALVGLAVSIARVAVVTRSFAMRAGDKRKVRQRTSSQQRSGEFSSCRHCLFSPSFVQPVSPTASQ
jgi:hypothetical protein